MFDSVHGMSLVVWGVMEVWSGERGEVSEDSVLLASALHTCGVVRCAGAWLARRLAPRSLVSQCGDPTVTFA